MTAHIMQADARALPLPAASVDSIVCDPPYELGFMGRKWDNTGVAYDVNTWREALRVLKPGGHLLAFGGTRTSHRMVCAIEDAGFELVDTIAWLYGSGMPKSWNISKAIDKAAGAEREVIGVRTYADGTAGHWTPADTYAQDEWSTTARGKLDTAPATDDARRWQGWGTALKPSFEPVTVARKPVQGTIAANVLAYGTGGINVDGCRVPGIPPSVPQPALGVKLSGGVYGFGTGEGRNGAMSQATAGRWPTNVVLTHQPLIGDDGEVIGDACADGCVAGCPVAELDAQSGVSRSVGGVWPQRELTSRGYTGGGYGQRRSDAHDFKDGVTKSGYSDSGGASRYFPTFRYQAKADGWERPNVDGVQHETVKPLELIAWLLRLVTPPGGTALDMFVGSGTAVEAAIGEGFNIIGSDLSLRYLPLIKQRRDRGLRMLEPGIAKLARTKLPAALDGQLTLAELFAEEA